MATTAAKPQRIQLSRRKGFKLQAASIALNGLPAVKCARPTPFGNPFKVGELVGTNGAGRPRRGNHYLYRVTDAADAVALYRASIEDGELPDFLPPFQFPHLPVPDAWDASDLLRMLRGRNLACFCALDKPCHCDVLLELANA